MTGREYVQKHIVTVEDEPAIVDLLSYVLDAPQVLLTTCTDGAEGLAAIRDQVPDLVIMDLMLPVLNGWQVYDALREDEATRNLPVIILSVAGDESERREAFRGSEVDFFMNKPFDPRALRRIVQEILDIKIDAW
ncbi:MAG: response regulator [Chloroflexi bacterium]|nr:response regulator [Chloroflexota bacterium]